MRDSAPGSPEKEIKLSTHMRQNLPCVTPFVPYNVGVFQPVPVKSLRAPLSPLSPPPPFVRAQSNVTREGRS